MGDKSNEIFFYVFTAYTYAIYSTDCHVRIRQPSSPDNLNKTALYIYNAFRRNNKSRKKIVSLH